MIGVVANKAGHSAVAEFFELFKTPWEFWRPGVRYDVLLCSDSMVPENDAKLVLLYGSRHQPFEEHRGIKTHSVKGPDFVSFRGERIPIYGNSLLFEHQGSNIIINRGASEAAAIAVASDNRTVIRLGFDLFQEVQHLLTKGQPAELAGIPTLELHVSLLRDLIVNHGITLVEIPPVPAGHRFMVCLTHDVDHPRVRNHMFDHTMFGFLYRALIVSVIDFCRRRRSLRQVATNWKAACSLPLVFCGIAKDFWNQIGRYLKLENDFTSTFFVIPTKEDAGVDPDGRIREKRAAGYSLSDIADDLLEVLSANHEVAVHGIDAWRDSTKGREECKRIQNITGTLETGVRMHWLYFDSHAPSTLEKAGFSYDSTVGYNETIGYRAGTTQVFKHVGVDRLLELPLHVMDTALFYPSYLNLSIEQARAATLALIEHVTRFGGVLTINWHDRSLGPERLWGDAYISLLGDLRARMPWFATASQTVSWFRKRRAASFVRVTQDDSSVQVRTAKEPGVTALPPLTLRVYNRDSSQHNLSKGNPIFEDFTIDGSDEVLVAA
jgi:hypothetical protein